MKYQILFSFISVKKICEISWRNNPSFCIVLFYYIVWVIAIEPSKMSHHISFITSHQRRCLHVIKNLIFFQNFNSICIWKSTQSRINFLFLSCFLGTFPQPPNRNWPDQGREVHHMQWEVRRLPCMFFFKFLIILCFYGRLIINLMFLFVNIMLLRDML